MDAFSYLSVLLSIILGLAMTEILQNYRALILNRSRVLFDATPLLWSGLVLLFATQSWWASFGLRDLRNWNFLGFVIVLLQMALLYMMAAVVLPDAGRDGPVDLAAHHRSHHRIFFALFFALIVTSLIKDRVLGGAFPTGENLYFHGGMALAATAGIVLTGQRAQLILVALTGAMFAAYIVLLFDRLDGAGTVA